MGDAAKIVGGWRKQDQPWYLRSIKEELKRVAEIPLYVRNALCTLLLLIHIPYIPQVDYLSFHAERVPESGDACCL